MSILERLTFAGPSFDAARDILNLSGKVILVTGGNNGIGLETILQLAKHSPAKLYMGARNARKAEAAIARVKTLVPDATVSFLEVDVSSFASVKAAAYRFLADNERLDILINNAGIMGVEPSLSEDGYEITFATNHLGPALLTKLLLPALTRSSTPRVVNIASVLYNRAPSSGIFYDKLKTDCAGIGSLGVYAVTKLANIYHAQELGRRNPGITAVSLHPGLVRTDIIGDHAKKESPIFAWMVDIPGRLVSVDVKTGALNQLWASTSGEVRNGAFYMPYGKLIIGPALVEDKAAARELWEWTENEFKKHGF